MYMPRRGMEAEFCKRNYAQLNKLYVSELFNVQTRYETKSAGLPEKSPEDARRCYIQFGLQKIDSIRSSTMYYIESKMLLTGNYQCQVRKHIIASLEIVLISITGNVSKRHKHQQARSLIIKKITRNKFKIVTHK